MIGPQPRRNGAEPDGRERARDLVEVGGRRDRVDNGRVGGPTVGAPKRLGAEQRAADRRFPGAGRPDNRADLPIEPINWKVCLEVEGRAIVDIEQRPHPRSAIADRVGALMMYLNLHVVTTRSLQCVNVCNAS